MENKQSGHSDGANQCKGQPGVKKRVPLKALIAMKSPAEEGLLRGVEELPEELIRTSALLATDLGIAAKIGSGLPDLAYKLGNFAQENRAKKYDRDLYWFGSEFLPEQLRRLEAIGILRAKLEKLEQPEPVSGASEAERNGKIIRRINERISEIKESIWLDTYLHERNLKEFEACLGMEWISHEFLELAQIKEEMLDQPEFQKRLREKLEQIAKIGGNTVVHVATAERMDQALEENSKALESNGRSAKQKVLLIADAVGEEDGKTRPASELCRIKRKMQIYDGIEPRHKQGYPLMTAEPLAHMFGSFQGFVEAAQDVVARLNAKIGELESISGKMKQNLAKLVEANAQGYRKKVGDTPVFEENPEWMVPRLLADLKQGFDTLMDETKGVDERGSWLGDKLNYLVYFDNLLDAAGWVDYFDRLKNIMAQAEVRDFSPNQKGNGYP